MTKAEFGEQFKRLRVAGYRLPVFEGVTVKDVTDEWFGTFGACSQQEFAHAIDQLKKAKTDTFWPAPGELWVHVYEFRKARRIRLQSQSIDDGRDLPQQVRDELAANFRSFAEQLSKRMSMPKGSQAIGAQEAADAELIAQEDSVHAAEGEVNG